MGLLNVFRAIASGWSLQIHADVISKASTSALNKLNLGVTQLSGHYAPWSSSLIPAKSEKSATYFEAYKAASSASRKFIDVRLCEDATCATCKESRLQSSRKLLVESDTTTPSSLVESSAVRSLEMMLANDFRRVKSMLSGVSRQLENNSLAVMLG